MKTESQNLQIAKWLRDNGSIHFFEAIEKFACARLSARIHDLRKMGFNILSVPTKLPSGKRVVVYRWVRTERNQKILEAMK